MNQRDEKKTLTPEYFDDVYNANDDPWNFASSRYEAEKYIATLNALPREKYESAFEIGCSIGVLTAKLAAHCKSLLSVDVNEKALAQARERCRELENVRFQIMSVPQEFPDEVFDLILVSEVGYYLDKKDWQTAFDKIFEHLNSGGNVILVHFTPFVHDYPQTGDEVHDSFAEWSENKLRLIEKRRAEKYRLDVWEKI